MNSFIRFMEWIGVDYVMHFLVGFAITAIFSPFGFCMILVGGLLSILLGLCKEWYDNSNNSKCDWKDFRFTSYGGIVATIYFLLMNLL